MPAISNAPTSWAPNASSARVAHGSAGSGATGAGSGSP